VFTSHLGAALDAGNVRKMFKRVYAEAGTGDTWTPRELRTTFVSLLTHRGVSIEEIARLTGARALQPNLAPAGPGAAEDQDPASRRSLVT
jgi:site-specific recombinase XerD